MDICTGILEHGLKLRWAVRDRANKADPEMYNLMRIGLTIALLLIGSYLAGCETGAEEATMVPINPPEPTHTPVPPDLEGTLWKLDSFLNKQGELVDLLSNSEITLEFEADRIAGFDSAFDAFD